MNYVMRVMLAMAASLFLLTQPTHGDEVVPSPASLSLPNAYCPVMPEEEALESIYVEYQGEKIYLCCPRCRRMFLEDPERYLDKLPQFAQVADTAESRHDYAADHANPDGALARTVQFVGRFHPVLVHFPIALVIAALLAEIIALFARPDFFRAAGRFTIILAGISVIAAAPTGWASAAFAQYPGLDETLEWHRWTGTVAGILIVTCAALSERAACTGNRKLHRVYFGALITTTLLTIVVGHLGATLIYGPDHFRF